jgi:hypothetical protein
MRVSRNPRDLVVVAIYRVFTFIQNRHVKLCDKKKFEVCMVATWQSEQREDVSCKQCGAVYSCKVVRLPVKDIDKFNCTACGELIDSWNTTTVPQYTAKTSQENS